jgi:PleD family two-component response regulator
MEKTKTVLAIDDNATQLEIFKKYLGQNYNIWVVKSASEALQYLNSKQADIILLDIEMPNVDGFEFLYDIRKIPSYMTVPIIIISGKTGNDFYDEAKSSSAFDVLSKPLEADALIRTIESALSTAHQ